MREEFLLLYLLLRVVFAAKLVLTEEPTYKSPENRIDMIGSKKQRIIPVFWVNLSLPKKTQERPLVFLPSLIRPYGSMATLPPSLWNLTSSGIGKLFS